MASRRRPSFRVPADEKLPLKYWQAVVELKPDGDRRRRKYIRSKDRDKCDRLYKQAVKDRESSGGDMPTRAITVGAWVDQWFTSQHLLEIKPKTAHTYRGLIRREIIPALGDVKLERLSPADVREMLSGITGKGLSSTTAAQVHRILSIALKAAMVDGHVVRNVAALVKPPRATKPDILALNAQQGMRVLESTVTDPWGSLAWAVLLTGARQGELLGLESNRVSDVLDLSWQLQRLTWEHGCGETCGRRRGADCPSRKITHPADWKGRPLEGGLWLTPPKSRAGTRVIPLVEPLRTVLLRHIEQTSDQPNPHGLVWHMADGSPIDPRVESEWWHRCLAKTGVPDVRLHDGRHTTVDLLYEAGVPEDVIVEIVGHSVRATTRGYKSGVDMQRRTDAMQRLALKLAPGFLDTPQAIAE